MDRVAVVMGKMHSGGKKNLVMEYYRHMDKTDIQFDFICDEDSNSIPKEEIESLGGRVYIVANYQHIFKNMHDIYKLCRENKYRIMHAYNGTMNIFPLFVGWLAGTPFRINESISMAHRADKKTALKTVLKPFSRCFATNFMANGEECGRWQFGNKLFDEGKVAIFKTVINVNDNTYAPELRNLARTEYGLSDDFVVGHIARLTIQKNTLFVIDIFHELLKIKENAKLLVIGEGELHDQMFERIQNYGIEDKVLYLGRREDIRQFYNAMDCFLLPSLYEGLPVTGIEAQACGLPIFFSSEIPAESRVCDDVGFFIGLDKSAKEWAEIVVQRCANYHREDHSQQVKDAGFDSLTEAKKLEEYYKKMLAGN